jgi:hypothetical protein
MKLTGFPIYLIAICLSLYLLSLTFINGLNIASKLTPPQQNKVKEEVFKYCESTFDYETFSKAYPSGESVSKRQFYLLAFSNVLRDGDATYKICFDLLFK